MTSKLYKSMLSFVIGWFLFTTVASATTASSLEQNLRREMVTLPYYSMFDNVTFELEGSNVTLTGEVWWPALKRSIERVVGRVEGITGVDNQITVLPNSYRDDDLRLATARALFSNSSLSKYLWSGASFGLLPYRSDIHIVVTHGNVTLEGMVLRQSDSDMATLAARGVSGVFSVTNNLRVKGTQEEI